MLYDKNSKLLHFGAGKLLYIKRNIDCITINIRIISNKQPCYYTNIVTYYCPPLTSIYTSKAADIERLY